MSMQERFDQMVEFTCCNQNLLMLLFNTGAFGTITEDEFPELLGNAIDKFAYSQTIDGVTKSYILAVGHLDAFPKYNMQDEDFQYVKFEYTPKEPTA